MFVTIVMRVLPMARMAAQMHSDQQLNKSPRLIILKYDTLISSVSSLAPASFISHSAPK